MYDNFSKGVFWAKTSKNVEYVQSFKRIFSGFRNWTVISFAIKTFHCTLVHVIVLKLKNYWIFHFSEIVCDDNDCLDDFNEVDDVIARGGPRFACRWGVHQLTTFYIASHHKRTTVGAIQHLPEGQANRDEM